MIGRRGDKKAWLDRHWPQHYRQPCRRVMPTEQLFESTVLHPAGYRCIRPLALLAISFVVGVIALVEHHAAVVFVSQDVRGDPIQEPPIVGDHQR